MLTVSGNASLLDDTLVISTSGVPSWTFGILFQGDVTTTPETLGDGLLCVGGARKRLFFLGAPSGSISAPFPGDPSISNRSALLGDPIAPGSTRFYQTAYRDSSPTFCPSPTGANWNYSSGLAVTWGL